MDKRFGDEHKNSSISTGTLLAKDLIPAFFEALALIDPEAVAALEEEFKASTYGDEWEDELGAALLDALDERAPEGFYFGAHPGDGADFGFWEAEDEQ